VRSCVIASEAKQSQIVNSGFFNSHLSPFFSASPAKDTQAAGKKAIVLTEGGKSKGKVFRRSPAADLYILPLADSISFRQLLESNV
jgi:hypothetical protein